MSNFGRRGTATSVELSAQHDYAYSAHAQSTQTYLPRSIRQPNRRHIRVEQP